VDVVGKEREREREREMGVMRQKQVSVRARASSSSAPAYALRVGVVGGATRRVVRETRANAVYDNYEPIPNGPESWPVPEFIEKTVAAFPEKAIANDEEVRVLLDHGYKWLDVRSKPEYDEERTVGSVNIPIINATKKFNTETRDKELVQGKKNEDFMKQVEKKFPKKDAYILVGCSDGRNRAIQALQLLDEAGYTNIVGIKGGFNKYYTTFDAKNRRRVIDVMESVYTADGDPAGIHDSGAQFDRMDAPPIIIRVDNTKWIQYTE